MENKETIHQIITDFLDKVFCQQDIPYVIEHLSRGISWMGEDLISSDYDEIVFRLLNQQKHYPNCTIYAPELHITKLSEYLYSVNGTYLIHPPKEKKDMLSPAFKASFLLDFSSGTHKFLLFHYDSILKNVNYRSLQDNPDFANNQLNVILDSIQGGLVICRLDASFPFVYVSNKLANLLGYTPDELMTAVNGSATNLIYPPDLSRLMSDCKDILSYRSNFYSSKYRVVCKDGSLKWIVDSGNVVTLKSGEKLINSLYLDVTDSENVQMLLAEQNHLLNSIYDSILCGIIRIRVLHDDTFEYVFINKAAWTIMGYESEEACRADGPANFIKNIAPEHVARFRNSLLQLCDSNEYVEEETLVNCVDGQQRWISGSTRLFVNAKGELILQSTLVDTTRQRQLELKLQEEQAEIRRLHNARHTRIFQAEYSSLTNINLEDGTFEREMFSAPYFSNITQSHGYYKDLFEAVKNEIHPDDVGKYAENFSLESFLKIARSKVTPGSISAAFRLKNKANITWLESTAFFIQDGNKVSVSITIKNITGEMRQRQLLEDALNSAQDANMAKSNFLSRMSHDIRTPLNAIMGMTAIAATHIDDRERVADCLEKINVSSKHLLGLINEVLDMSRIENGKMSLTQDAFCISKLIDNLQAMIKPLLLEKQQNFQVNIRQLFQEEVIGDLLRLQQIFMNILSNAIKYTPECGNISLCVSEKASDIQGYGCYEFIVEDNGIGMSKEFVKHIFEPFSRESSVSTRHCEGTGLGMAISQNLVRMMQGRIDVESVKNKGSKFTVTIYLQHQTQPSGASESSSLPVSTEDDTTNVIPSFAGRRVLLVEDNELNMEIAENILREKGIIVEKAWNGKEAYDTFMASEVGYFDLICMDIQMPVLNGYQATNAIRHSKRPDGKTIPILAMTANVFVEDIQAVQNASMNEHIAKPLNPQALYQALSHWLR